MRNKLIKCISKEGKSNFEEKSFFSTDFLISSVFKAIGRKYEQISAQIDSLTAKIKLEKTLSFPENSSYKQITTPNQLLYNNQTFLQIEKDFMSMMQK